MTKFNTGDIAIYNGNEAEVVAVSGGWTTIITQEGRQVKARNSQLSAPGAKPAKPAKASKPAKPAKPKASKPKVEGDEDEDEIQPVRLHPDLTKYTKHDTKTTSGRRCIDIADEVADLLRGEDLESVYKIGARKLSELGSKVKVADLQAQYEHLNPGMQRMNIGNRLRAAIRKFEEEGVAA